MSNPSGDDKYIDLWNINAVAGQVTFLAHGEVFMLHTSSGEVTPEDMFTRRAPGLPVELTRVQALGLVRVILNALGQPENPEKV